DNADQCVAVEHGQEPHLMLVHDAQHLVQRVAERAAGERPREHCRDRHRQRLALTHGENARVVLPTENVVDGRHGFSLRSLPRLPANGAGGARSELLPAVAPHCDPRSCCPAPSPDSLPKGWPARRCPLILYLAYHISDRKSRVKPQLRPARIKLHENAGRYGPGPRFRPTRPTRAVIARGAAARGGNPFAKMSATRRRRSTHTSR